MPALAEKREALLGAFAECLILLGENGEVQDFLNFVVQGFRIFAILAALSGDGRPGTMEHEEELDSLLSGDML